MIWEEEEKGETRFVMPVKVELESLLIHGYE